MRLLACLQLMYAAMVTFTSSAVAANEEGGGHQAADGDDGNDPDEVLISFSTFSAALDACSSV